VMEKKLNKATTTLAFTLSTSDNPELLETADLLKETWGKIGVKVTIEKYDAATLNQTIIRPRKYDALLFGEVIGRDIDLYPFWHSSQRNDPGLNVALYANIKADKALENARKANSDEERLAAYKNLNSEIVKDVPAVFLYSPQYIYVVPKKLQGVSSSEIETPQDRFDGIEKKYIEEKKVFKFLQKNN
jgi:peptide/nickel transport system substrate-binding protein